MYKKYRFDSSKVTKSKKKKRNVDEKINLVQKINGKINH